MKLKKKEGRVDKMALLEVSIVALFIALIISVYALGDMDKKTKVNKIGRDYLLTMEAKGYLTTSNEQYLINELANLGVKNISTNGTTKTKVGYGNNIYLKVVGKIEVSSFSIPGLFDIKEEPKLIDIYINEKSTAKH